MEFGQTGLALTGHMGFVGLSASDTSKPESMWLRVRALEPLWV